MERIEPTISTLDLAADPGADAKIRAQVNSRRLRSAFTGWAVTLLLFASVCALCYAGALYAGIIPEQFRPGTPALLARTSIVVGFAVLFGSHIAGSLVLFRYGFERGALALLLPGYLFIALKRSGIFWHVMGPWCIGLGLVVVGTVLFSS
jgi:hypothetical protein